MLHPWERQPGVMKEIDLSRMPEAAKKEAQSEASQLRAEGKWLFLHIE